MRVTNLMTHNTSLANINRNMRHLQRLYEQTTSGKIISRPSQDPLISSRSLRFRSQISNIEQHQRNVESGHAWMNVTEAAFFNLLRGGGGGDGNPAIFTSIKDELLNAASDHSTLEDKLIMLTHVENLMEQIGLEMNQTLGGRFVFAGWRTNQPPVLMANMPGESHVITQTLNVQDIEQTYSFRRPVPPFSATNPMGLPETNRVNILKLPFADRNLSFGASTVPGAPVLGIFSSTGTPVPFNIESRSETDADVFSPGPDDIFYVQETGELVLGSNVLAAFEEGGVFENGISLRYQVSDLQAGDLNPFVYFDTVSTVHRVSPAVDGVSNHWPFEADQTIRYQFNHGSPTHVNSLATNIFTDTMFADLRRLISFANSLTPSNHWELEELYSSPPPHGQGLSGQELENAVSQSLAQEYALIRSVLYDRINNMIDRMDRYTIEATREHTHLGSRMHRVGMFELRLEQDELNYTRLMSNNEDVDVFFALMQQSAAEFSFQEAIRVIANSVQLSLLQFI